MIMTNLLEGNFLLRQFKRLAAAGCMGLILLLGQSPCFATPPLMDILIQNDEIAAFWMNGSAWRPDLPSNQKLENLQYLHNSCSASGGPRGEWKLEGEKLWLIGFVVCGGKIRIETVYGGDGLPVFADWITGELVSNRGRVLCGYPYSTVVYERTVTLRIEKGLLRNVSVVSNENHPAVPKSSNGSSGLECLPEKKR